MPEALVVAVQDTVETARAMWETHGQTVSAVRQFVERATPPEHVQLVLEEAYRDALGSDEYPRTASATPVRLDARQAHIRRAA